MADKTVTSEDRDIDGLLQTVITDNKDENNEGDQRTSENKNVQKGEESSSEFTPGKEEWPSGFPLLRMALLGLPRPYDTTIHRKPVPSTKTLSVDKACGTDPEKSSHVEELKPILFVSVKEEVEEPEDCKTVPDWEDEATEADSLSDTIYPALLCSPDLQSPSPQGSPHHTHGGATEEQTWSYTVKEVGTDLSSSSIEKNLEHCHLKLSEINGKKRTLQVRECDCTQKTEDNISCCCGSETSDCSGVFFLHGMQHKRSGTKLFTCSTCGKAYKQLKNYNKHLDRLCKKKLHSEVSVRKVSSAKKLRCDVCDRKFTTNQHLRNHVLTHNGKRPYVCDVCECSFIYKSHVARHRLTHTNERCYICDYCSYSFIQKSNFDLHVRTMACMPTSTAKRVCDVCYQAFSKQMYLDSHFKKHASIFLPTE